MSQSVLCDAAGQGEGAGVELADIKDVIRKDLSFLSEKAGLKNPKFGDTELVDATVLPGTAAQRAVLYEKLIHSNINNVEPERQREALFVKLNLRDGYPGNSSLKRLAVLAESWGFTIPGEGMIDKGRSKRARDIASAGEDKLATLISKEIAWRDEQEAWDELLDEVLVEQLPSRVSPVGIQPSGPKTSSSEPDVSVESIEMTLVLDDDGRPISRKSVITVGPVHHQKSPVSILEASDDEFEIGDSANGTLLNLNDGPLRDLKQILSVDAFRQVLSMDAERRDIVLAAALDSADDDLRQVIEGLRGILAGRVGNMLNRMQPALQTLTTSGVPCMLVVESPSQEDESLTFTYDVSYSRPVSKPYVGSGIVLGGSSSRLLGYAVCLTGSGGTVFGFTPQLTVPAVTVRVKTQRQLEVAPFLYDREARRTWSMPFIPAGHLNIIKHASDGIYGHTFHDVDPGSPATLVWSVE